MIAFALHFFSVRIFPVCPCDLGIIINVFAQDYNRELHVLPVCVSTTLYRATTYWRIVSFNGAWIWLNLPCGRHSHGLLLAEGYGFAPLKPDHGRGQDDQHLQS